jgi:hypothetical protein
MPRKKVKPNAAIDGPGSTELAVKTSRRLKRKKMSKKVVQVRPDSL